MPIVKCHDRKRNITYVYESTGFVDEKTGKYHYKRRLIGKVDPVTGETVPTGPHGGARQKKEDKFQGEWIPMKPGRKKKIPQETPAMADQTGAPAKTTDTESETAKDTIRRLELENLELRRKYVAVVNAYNRLVDGIERLGAKHLDA